MHECQPEKVTSFINNSSGKISSSDSLKLLGFNFTEAPNVEAHVKSLAKKVHLRTWSLINLKRAGVSNDDVLTIYKSIVRSVLDYASVTYNSLLTKEQEDELERLQRMCFRVIYGWEKPYSQLLQETAVTPLKERREELCLKFAEGCLEHDTFKSWFPLEPPKEHDLRATRKFAIPKFNCNRYDNSPLNYMRKLLNGKFARDQSQSIVNRYSK